MAGVIRGVCAVSFRNFNFIRINSSIKLLKTDWKHQTDHVSNISIRGIKRWQVEVMKQMKRRRARAEPEILPRSAFVNWNYSAELFAFTKRINEELSEETLNRALIHPSYIEKELKRREELGVTTETTLNLVDNTEFVKSGSALIHNYITSYLKEQCPSLPNDGLSALHDHLVSDQLLAYVAENLGMSDLILSSDFPVEQKTLALSLKALIGAILNDEGKEKAEIFTLDLIITQLIGKELTDIWEIPNPMGTLINILAKDGKSDPEPRLLRESGRNTIFSSYIVGLYLDKELIGQGPGETIEVAIEVAALDALKRIFQITDNKTPFPFLAKNQKNTKLINQNSNLLNEKVQN